MLPSTSEPHAEPEQHHDNDHDDDATEKAVTWTRYLVVAVFSLCAVVVGSLTFVVCTREETDDYQQQFYQSAREVLRVASDKASVTSKMTAGMAQIYTSFSHDREEALPFVTLADFEAFGQGVRRGSSASLVFYTPYLETEDARKDWVNHSQEHSRWIEQGHAFYANSNYSSPDHQLMTPQIWKFSHYFGQEPTPEMDLEGPPYAPLWQMSPPPPDASRINLNLMRQSGDFEALMQSVRSSGLVTLSPPSLPVVELLGSALPPDVATTTPSSILLGPVFNAVVANFVGAISVVVPWSVYFANVLPDGTNGIVVVVDSCGQNMTYTIDGPAVEFLGSGDLHDTDYTDMVVAGPLTYHNGTAEDFCLHRVYIFPSRTFEETYRSKEPILYTVVAVAMICFSALVFLAYDISVANRQKKTQRRAHRTNEMVAQLFPGAVRDLLFRNDSRDQFGKKRKKAVATQERGDKGLASLEKKHEFVSQGENRSMADRPIAELFPEASVMYADIAGFTAWSSIREPQQVFTLLESIFQTFDEIATRHGVFKVETVGDCYVAVVGVPEPCEDHAVVIASFARECIEAFDHVVGDLELTLGPDTGDLAMRIGIHSGPVTAGVLRGDRARFQLFGDTVNIVAKIESTGRRDCIHLSEQTAALIAEAGHSDWVTPRADLVDAKDLGVIATYWLRNSSDSASHPNTSSQVDDEDVARELLDSELPSNEGISDDHNRKSSIKKKKKRVSKRQSSRSTREKRIQRLVDWNCELLAQLLRQVVARRAVARSSRPTNPTSLMIVANSMGGDGNQVVDEVAEIVSLPAFDGNICEEEDMSAIQISDEALAQLHLYVSTIASMYRDNPFHSFEHASHVCMSVSKLLSRIVAPQIAKTGDARKEQELLHDHTYGITSDPLTQFSVVLSALIHDVDHRGVPNFVLSLEDKTLAAAYKGKSIAEQNSVDLAWNALMSEGFEELRQCIFSDVSELRRFRQLLINCVIATDIFDKELGTLRKKRWKTAFDEADEPESSAHSMHGSVNMEGLFNASMGRITDFTFTRKKVGEQVKADIDRKATIVIEHLIQASDVAHTMQHWQVYQRWNEKLFHEMYEAFLSGRSDKDPSMKWYEGELGFFDNYIIPLAKKLKECGVFGVASDEYLNYALENRREWEVKGPEVVEKYVAKFGN